MKLIISYYITDFQRAEDENTIQEEEMEEFLNKLAAIEIAQES